MYETIAILIAALIIIMLIIFLYTFSFSNNYETFDTVKDMLLLDQVLDNDCIVQNKDNTLFSIIEIKGIDYNAITENEAKQIFVRTKNWLNELSNYRCYLRFISTRFEKSSKLNGTFPNQYLEKIHDKWMTDFNPIYENQHFIIISTPPKESLLLGSAPNLALVKDLVVKTKEMLFDHSPKVISNKDSKNIITAISKIIYPHATMHYSDSDNFASLSQGDVAFDEDNGYAVIDHEDQKIYVQAIAINCWNNTVSSTLFSDILQLSCEIIISNNFKGNSVIEMIQANRLPHQAKQARINIGGEEAYKEYQDVIKNLENGHTSVYEVQSVVFVRSSSIKNNEASISNIKKILIKNSVTFSVAKRTIKQLFLNIFPTNDLLIYANRLESDVISQLLQFDGGDTGFYNSDWGKGPIRFFKKADSSSYALQLHDTSEQNSLAHGLVIAPSGSGKTTLMQHLIGGALRHKIQAYIFDRLDGTKIFTNFIGGSYINPKNIMNPICCEDSYDNRVMLGNLISMMCNLGDDDKETINGALDIIFAIPKERRILGDLINIAFPSSEIRNKLKNWSHQGMFGGWFNGIDKNGNAYDALQIASQYLITFNMTEIQQDHILSASVTYYIMHKIINRIRNHNSPHMIVVDEARPQLKDKLFQEYIAQMLLEHRKLRGSIILCFQDMQSILDNKIGQLIIEQCPTKYIFPNPRAKKSEYDKLGLTEFEWEYVIGNNQAANKLYKTVLVKKTNQSSIINIDISKLGGLKKIYSSNMSDINEFNIAKAKKGDYLDDFLRCAK